MRRALLCAALAALASFATSSTRDAHPKWWHLLRGAHAVRPRDGAKPQPNKRALQPHALHLLQTANASAHPPRPAAQTVDALTHTQTADAEASAQAADARACAQTADAMASDARLREATRVFRKR